MAWISMLDLAPGTDGYQGGPWRLTVIALFGPYWAPLVRDESASRGGMVVTRSHDGLLLRVEVSDSRPFQEAAEDYGLDPRVFGSMTLWPAIHHKVEHVEAGWLWTHTAVSDEFPFTRPREPERANKPDRPRDDSE